MKTEEIKDAFRQLDKNEQVNLLVILYLSMYAAQKDAFLHEIEN